jgi:hypothetical protein
LSWNSWVVTDTAKQGEEFGQHEGGADVVEIGAVGPG